MERSNIEYLWRVEANREKALRRRHQALPEANASLLDFIREEAET